MSILSHSEESNNTQSSEGIKFPFSCQDFALQINKLRFNIEKVFSIIQEKIKEGKEKGNKKISFLTINQEIEFDDECLMETVAEYFNENNVVNSFLPEFCFNSNTNRLFFENCLPILLELLYGEEEHEKKLAIQRLRELVPSDEYIIYRLKNIDMTDVKTTLLF